MNRIKCRDPKIPVPEPVKGPHVPGKLGQRETEIERDREESGNARALHRERQRRENARAAHREREREREEIER